MELILRVTYEINKEMGNTYSLGTNIEYNE